MNAVTPSRSGNLAKTLGATLARKRAAVGMSQEAMAEHLGIGQEAVSRIERGVVTPSIERLLDFCEVFQCGIEELLGSVSERPSDRALMISRQLASLAEDDQEFVLKLIQQISQRLNRQPKRRHR